MVVASGPGIARDELVHGARRLESPRRSSVGAAYRVTRRRSIVVALSATVVVACTAGSLMAAGTMVRSRNAVTRAPSATPQVQRTVPRAIGPNQTAAARPTAEPAPAGQTPDWFPKAPDNYAPGQRDNEYQALRRIILKAGDTDGNGCLSEAEARALYDAIRGTGIPMGFRRFDDWLEGQDYLRSNPTRRKEIIDSIFRKFGTKNGLGYEGFRKFLYWLGLMCS